MTGISPTDNVMAIRNAILQKNAALRDVASTGSVGGANAPNGTAPGTAPGGFTEALHIALVAHGPQHEPGANRALEA